MAFQPGPQLRAPGLLDHLPGGAGDPHEQGGRVAAAALGEQPGELVGVGAVTLGPALGHVVGHLVYGHAVGRDPRRGGFEDQGATRRRPVQVCPPTRLGDERLDVLDLALHSVRRRVATVAPAPPVVVVRGEPPGQPGREGRILRAVDEAAADQDDGRSVTLPIEGDRRPVLRRHPVHRCPSRDPGRRVSAGHDDMLTP
jgi:hypothetical protein